MTEPLTLAGYLTHPDNVSPGTAPAPVDTLLRPLNPADYPAHPATEWDLLAFRHSASQAGRLTSTWLIGPHAGVTVERTVTYDRGIDGESEGITLTNPLRPTGEPLTLSLDYRQTPDKAERHQIHDDALGVTLCEPPQGTPTAVYRLPEGAHPTFTPVETYAQDTTTYQDIRDGLRAYGVDARVEGLDDGTAVEFTDPTDPQHAYQVYGIWMPTNGVPHGWAIFVGQRVSDGADTYFDFWTNEDVRHLHLPLDTPVETIVETTVALLHDLAPGSLGNS